MIKTLVAGILLTHLSAHSFQQGKLPIPSDADEKAAANQIKEIYSKEFSDKSRDSKRALGRKLLAQAMDASNTPGQRYGCLVWARDKAAEALDLDTALAAVDKLDGIFQMPKPPLTGATFNTGLHAQKAAVLGAAKKSAGSPEDLALISDAYLKIAEQALKAMEYDDAATAAQQAGQVSKDVSVKARANELVHESSSLKQEHDALRKAEAALAANPEDPEANVTVGLYLCFAKGDWLKGLPLVAKGGNVGLKDLAQRELAKPEKSDAQVELGEAWGKAAEKEKVVSRKKQYQGRARHWLKLALASASGLSKVRIEKRLSELEAQSEPTSVDLIKLFDSKNSIHGAWTCEGRRLLSPKDTHARLLFPVEPPEEYDLLATAQREGDGGAFYVFLPVRGGRVTVTIDGKDGVLGAVENAEKTYYREKMFKDKGPHQVAYQVRRNRLVLLFDGRKIIDWTDPDFAGTKVPEKIDTPKKGIVVGTCDGSYAVTSLVLKYRGQ